ncbi:MAG: 8-oxo-dGTP diphosphatase [Myxococcota bacterium]|jgi:8-oxo-dGTP diphosphatase
MRTRVSIYALAVHDERVLLTQLAPHCYNGGHWTLPGGGMDHGELPEATVVREAYEETGLTASRLELLHVHSFSESREGKEPFLAVQIIYRAILRGEPKVLEVGGSTAAAAWVPLSKLAEMPQVPLVAAALKQHAATP